MDVHLKGQAQPSISSEEQYLPLNLPGSFLEIRSKTKQLTDPLLPEDFVSQPMVDVSPPKWHLGHTSWFFEEFILSRYKKDYKLFDKDFAFLFNSYYNSVGNRVKRNNRGNLMRPPINKVFAYRDYIDEQMILFISSRECTEEVCKLIELGLQHEQQHQELFLTDIKYIFSQAPLLPAYMSKEPFVFSAFSSIEPGFLNVEGGLYKIGYEGKGFCFDNEKGGHNTYLHPYKIMDRLVTNREYLEFIEDGGYARFDFWLSEGWDWINEKGIKAPLYWFQNDGEWHQFTLYGLRKINMEEPVSHVSYFEADAFAAWAGKRLPTEFEWEVAAQLYAPKVPGYANMLDNGYHNPTAKMQDNYQFFGDNWEWTSSAYLPYPFYKKQNGALGEYNGKFMVNQMILRGGSCVTPSNHIRHTYRNFFHPHQQWQFSGIRLAESI